MHRLQPSKSFHLHFLTTLDHYALQFGEDGSLVDFRVSQPAALLSDRPASVAAPIAVVRAFDGVQSSIRVSLPTPPTWQQQQSQGVQVEPHALLDEVPSTLSITS